MYALLPSNVPSQGPRIAIAPFAPIGSMASTTELHLTPTAVARYVRERLTTAIASTDRVIQRAHPTADDLHDLHRDLRRLRTLARLATRIAHRAGRTAWPSLDARLQRLTQMVGEVRDLDVALRLVDGFLAGAAPSTVAESSALVTLRRRLRDDTRTGRELLRATLRAERNSGLFEEVAVALGGSITAPSPRSLAHGLEVERHRLARSARRARKKVVRRPSADGLHEVRVRVRRWRYLSDLEDALRGTSSSSFPRRFATIQRRLGDLHDRDVLAERLDRLDPSHRREEWARAFHEERRKMRRELLSELRETKLRHHRTGSEPPTDPAPADRGAPHRARRSGRRRAAPVR